MTRLDEVKKPKIQESLKANLEQLKLALQLVSFRHQLPLDVDLEGLVRKELHAAEARALFTELEFYRLSNEMPSAPATPLRQAASLVRDEAGLKALCETLARAARVSLAPAFEGEPHSADLIGLGCVLGTETCVYLVVPAIGRAAMAALLGPALRRTGLQIETHDGKALLHLLASVGIEGVTLHTDVELHLLPAQPLAQGARAAGSGARAPAHRAARVARRSVRPGQGQPGGDPRGAGGHALRRLGRRGGPAGGRSVDRDRGHGPGEAGQRARAAAGAGAHQDGAHRRAHRSRGAGGDLGGGRRLGRGDAQGRLPGRPAASSTWARPRSWPRCSSTSSSCRVLKKKTGSTDHEVLEKLAEEHPLPRAIIEYRTVAKLKSTYLDTLPTLIGADGRIRTTFHQAAAATGRLSSTNPNLQNIPIRTELGKQIRRAFVAEPGWVLVSADYSQVELRILAHISGDEGLVKRLRRGRRRARAHRRGGLRRAAGRGDRRAAPRGEDGQLRHRLRAVGARARRRGSTFPSRSRSRSSSGTSRASPASTGTWRARSRRRAAPATWSRSSDGAATCPTWCPATARCRWPPSAPRSTCPFREARRTSSSVRCWKWRSSSWSRSSTAACCCRCTTSCCSSAPEAEAGRLSVLAKRVMASVAQLKVPLVVDVGQGRSWAEAH